MQQTMGGVLYANSSSQSESRICWRLPSNSSCVMRQASSISLSSCMRSLLLFAGAPAGRPLSGRLLGGRGITGGAAPLMGPCISNALRGAATGGACALVDATGSRFDGGDATPRSRLPTFGSLGPWHERRCTATRLLSENVRPHRGHGSIWPCATSVAASLYACQSADVIGRSPPVSSLSNDGAGGAGLPFSRSYFSAHAFK